MFCPKCGDEFVAGIRVCPDCALSLVYEPPLKEPHEPAEGDELVAVATFQIVFDASVARGALEAEGMPAVVPGELVGSFSRFADHDSWAELKVRARDRHRAEELLKTAGHK